MGMRFDKVDPRLWAELGTKVGTAYVQSKAGDANAEGMKQSTQTTSNYGKVDASAVYTGEGADGTMTNAEAASYGINVPVEDKTAGTGVIRQYGLGTNPQKFQDAEFTPEQQRLGGLKSQAAFYAARGDTDQSNKILSQIQQGVLMDKQLEQADLQMAQSRRSGVREDKADAYEASRQEAFNGSVFGQQNATYAKQFQDYTAAKSKYEAGIAAGQSPQTLGLPPQQPARAAYSLADSLADQGLMLANDAKHGKVDAKAMGEFSEKLRKIEDEGTLKALNLAQGGGSIDEVAKAFNSSGQLKFDPKSVLSDKMVPGQGGVPERVITFKDENGNPQTINVMSQLKSLGKAAEVLNQFYAGETNRRGNVGEVRAEKSLVLHAQQVGIQGATAAASIRHNNASTADIEQKTADRKEQAEVKVAYGDALDSGDAKAIDAASKKLYAFGRSGKAGAEQTAFTAKVDLIRQGTPSMSLADAIKEASTKSSQSADSYFAEVLKPSGGISMSVKKAEEITRAAFPDWRSAAVKNGVTGEAAATGPKPSRAASGKVSDSPKKGAEQVISAGSNKGKTAVFDGSGWVLKP